MTLSGFGALPSVDVVKLNYLLKQARVKILAKKPKVCKNQPQIVGNLSIAITTPLRAGGNFVTELKAFRGNAPDKARSV
jgi:hypothetical protein